MEYRWVRAAADAALDGIAALFPQRERVLVAIDGRCGAGKTTLAAALKAALDCPVIPMDGFFLPPERRTAARLAEPGGNVDWERFYAEALLPLAAGTPFSYRPYDCRGGKPGAPVAVTPGGIAIVEGSYSCHPELRNYYDLRIFLTLDPAEQAARIRRRNGEAWAKRFFETWIPLEERYFAETGVQACCELQFST